MKFAVMLLSLVWFCGDSSSAPASADREPKSQAKSEPRSLNEILRSLEQLATNPYPGEKDQQRFQDLIAEGTDRFVSEPAMLYWIGDFLERQGEPEQAEAVWKKAIGKTSVTQGTKNKKAWARCSQRLGNRRLSEKDGAGAAEFARQSLKWAPDDLRGYQLLWDSALVTGEIFQVLPTLRLAAEKYGSQKPAFTSLYFDVLAQLGDARTLREELNAKLTESVPAADLHHFQGLLADLNDEPLAAFAHHYIAMNSGAMADSTTLRSRDFIDRLAQREEGALPPPVRDLVTAYLLADRPGTAEEALTILEKFSPQSPDQELAVASLRGASLNALRRSDEAATVWRKIIERWPDFVPAYCSLGEILEVNGKQAEAQALFETARKRSPNNAKVQQLFRLGGAYRVHDEGVLVSAVEKGSPLDRLGLKPGDVVVHLAGDSMRELPPGERLRAMRLFQGGPITYRTKEGEEIADEMEFMFLPQY